MFYFFIWWRHSVSASWKENDMTWYISVIRQTERYRTPVFTHPFSWCLLITITYTLPHLRLWFVAVVTVIAWTQSDHDLCIWKSGLGQAQKCEGVKPIQGIPNIIWFGLWCLTPQYFSYIVVVSFIDGGNRSTQRKPPISRKSLTNFIT